MNVGQLIEAVTNLADDSLPPGEVVGYLNDAMAKINTEVNANFPFFDINNQDEEPVFPEKWQRLLLIPFASARIKQKDSSQFEYQDLYEQFTVDLSEFKAKYKVPDAYLDEDSETGEPDFSDSYFRGDW